MWCKAMRMSDTLSINSIGICCPSRCKRNYQPFLQWQRRTFIYVGLPVSIALEWFFHRSWSNDDLFSDYTKNIFFSYGADEFRPLNEGGWILFGKWKIDDMIQAQADLFKTKFRTKKVQCSVKRPMRSVHALQYIFFSVFDLFSVSVIWWLKNGTWPMKNTLFKMHENNMTHNS